MIHIGEEAAQEENVGKPEEGDDSVCEKTAPLEEQAEEKTGKTNRLPYHPVAQPNTENQGVTTAVSLHRGAVRPRLGKRDRRVTDGHTPFSVCRMRLWQ